MYALALNSLYSLLPLLLISCVFHINLALLLPTSSPVVSPPYLSLSSQPETDAGLFIADKAANFINYEPICYSVCVPVCVCLEQWGDLRVP